jgi:hypothetical protein
MNEEDWEKIVPLWEDLIAHVDDEDDHVQIDTNIGEGDDNMTQDGNQSVLSISSNSCIASKKQLRLDKELHASGFSQKDAARANELHYFEAKPDIEPVQEEEEGEEEKSNVGENENAENDGEDKEKDINNEPDEYDGAISDKEDDDDSVTGQGGVQVQVYRDKFGEYDDDQSLANFSTVSRAQSYAEAEAKARERVRRSLIEQKKAKTRKGAYKSRNSNKSFNKGKRGFQDFSI